MQKKEIGDGGLDEKEEKKRSLQRKGRRKREEKGGKA